MSKDNYNIDSILSEVKKRREENEKEIIQKAESKLEEAPQEADEPELITKTTIIGDEIEDELSLQEEPIDEAPAEEVPTEEAPTEEEFVRADEISYDEPDFVEEITEAPEISEAVAENEPAEAVVPDGGKGKAELTKRQKRRKRVKKIIIALVVLIAVAIGFGVIYFNGLLNDMLDNKSNISDGVEEAPWAGMDGNEENFTPIYETEASELSSLQDMVKTWYFNGNPCSKSKVLNVLLVGEDTRGSEILDDGTRADAAIICSINAETKEITLTSILRDAYSYFETTPNDGTTGRFDKINAGMSLGNIGAYINCVENLYKIDIDNYVIVNFDSFESIVDTLGGVSLEISAREINEINTHPKRYNHTTIEKTFEGDRGVMKLTGKQALAYCRIRKLDSDNMRADRQKTCLIKMFEQAKSASPTQLVKIVKKMIPYVSTGFSKSEILKIAKYALTEKWLDYDTQMTSVPEANLRGGIFYGTWCWKCDFPQDAYNLQMRIYGKSSITLAHERPDTAKCPEKGFYNEGAPRIWQVIKNEHYGEATTIAPPETDENNDNATSN